VSYDGDVKRISVDLSEPFETVLTQALSLPAGGDDRGMSDARMALAMRSLYTAANGRTVATPIGRIPIAPAVAPWLKAAPLAVRTRRELLMLAGLSTDVNASTDDFEAGES
jgi:hypothetical protein